MPIPLVPLSADSLAGRSTLSSPALLVFVSSPVLASPPSLSPLTSVSWACPYVSYVMFSYVWHGKHKCFTGCFVSLMLIRA